MFLKVIPRTDFTTSFGDVAVDQFCQAVDTQIPGKIQRCEQDFLNVYATFAAALTPAEEATLAIIVANHTATGRLTVGPVSSLPTGLFEGEDGYATDGRKVGEGVGSGTGVPIYWSSGFWRVFSTDAQVQA